MIFACHKDLHEDLIFKLFGGWKSSTTLISWLGVKQVTKNVFHVLSQDMLLCNGTMVLNGEDHWISAAGREEKGGRGWRWEGGGGGDGGERGRGR